MILRLVLSLSWISGSLVVNYPYDDNRDGTSQYSQSPDDKVFQQLSKAYSQVTRHWILFRLGYCPSVVSRSNWKQNVELENRQICVETRSENLTTIVLIVVFPLVWCACRRTLWCTMDTLVRTCTEMNILKMASPMVPTGTVFLVSLRTSRSSL